MIAVRGGWAQKEHEAEKESVDSKLAVVRHSVNCSAPQRGSDVSEMHPETQRAIRWSQKVMPHKKAAEQHQTSTQK